MSQLNEKIRVLLHNREWTQADLAKRLNVAPTTVQKWVSGKNNPTLPTLKELSSLFCVSYKDLLDDDCEIPEYIHIGTMEPTWWIPALPKETTHHLFDAALKKNALLHRFENGYKEKYSAIYLGNEERWWTYREDEARMIKDWNEQFV